MEAQKDLCMPLVLTKNCETRYYNLCFEGELQADNTANVNVSIRYTVFATQVEK